ncbi:MAG: galactose-1-phosphate uridylyltransferase [Candidatus Velthaea sp.]
MSELRWNPLLGEWVATATDRQERTFLPPADYCPLCPTKPGGFPTEIPAPTFDIVVFENKFPSLRHHPPPPAVAGTDLEPVAPATGVCEVIVYTPEHAATLAGVTVQRIEHLVRVWTHRTRELARCDDIDYVFIFENKGEAIGVTLHHPHGQIYGYPFVPPRVATELARCREHMVRTGRCLLCDIRDGELADGRRIVGANDGFIAYVPFFARWPYETHIVSRRHVTVLPELTAGERLDLARLLKSTLTAFDGLFDRSFPYMMAIHQAPVDGGVYDDYHLHIEFYPPLRTATRLKYLAGSETGAGMFINDTLAEEKAAELRAHFVPVA